MALANMDVGAMEFSMGVADAPTKMDVSLDDLIKQVIPKSARATTINTPAVVCSARDIAHSGVAATNAPSPPPATLSHDPSEAP